VICGDEPSGSIKCREIFGWLGTCYVFHKDCVLYSWFVS
jgi:hypothetical protein